jgi:hypothetical protein
MELNNGYAEGVICPNFFKVGSTFDSLDLCLNALARAFALRGLNEQFGTRYNKSGPNNGRPKAMLACPPDANLRVKQADMKCAFQVHAAVVDSSGKWVVRSIVHHSCGGTGRRERGYDIGIKVAGSQAVAKFSPSPLNSNHFRHGDPKRLRADVVRDGGIPLSSQQSFKIVRGLTDISLADQVREVSLLPAYFDRLRREDPGGFFFWKLIRPLRTGVSLVSSACSFVLAG